MGMRIQYFNGGLANQVFQYIFYRYAQISSNNKDAWFLDDSYFFFKNEHNGYELEKLFGVKPNLLSSFIDPSGWNFFIENRKKGVGTAQTMQSMGIPIEMIAEATNYRTDNPFHGKVHLIPCNEYHPEILNFPCENIFFFGYWINKNWFTQYKDMFMEELSFPPLTDEQNLSYAAKIKSSLSVGVHIRRGDFVNLNWQLDASYYHDSAAKMIAAYPELTFFVFSDDIPWCREHADELGLSLAKEIVFIEGNVSGSNYIDMQLMTMCKGLLMSNSSFSYLAALLNRQLDFYINPVSYREL